MLYDKDIRGPLFEFLDMTFGKNRIIEEKRVGKARADIMMVLEDALVGIEIKSDADTYVRLPKQVKNYNLFFDYNIIVVGTKHAHTVTEHVPDWWGIITVEEVDGKVDFLYYREVKDNNKSRTRITRQTNILWRREIQNILARKGFHAYARQSRKFVVDKLVTNLPKEELKHEICYELFERDYTTIADSISEYKEAIKAKNSSNKDCKTSENKKSGKSSKSEKSDKTVKTIKSNKSNRLKNTSCSGNNVQGFEVSIFDFAIPDIED